MMNLMLEKMRQQAQAAVVLRCIPGNGHDLAEVDVAHLFAVGDQSPVDLRLFALEVDGLGKRLVVLEDHVAIMMRVVTAQLALKGIHVKTVAAQDVVEGCDDTGKEA